MRPKSNGVLHLPADPLPLETCSLAFGVGPRKEIQFFFAGLSDLHDDHQDADDQQYPGRDHHDPDDFSGDIQANQEHEYGQDDQKAEGIHHVVQENDTRKHRLHELDDPYTRLVGKKINERENVVQNLVQRFEIRRFHHK
jgi:hypothetical protein